MNNSPFLSGAEAQLAAGACLAGLLVFKALKEVLQQFEAVQEQIIALDQPLNCTTGNKR